MEVDWVGEFVRVEVADQIATIRLDRPKMNALNAQVQEEIAAAAAEVSQDATVRTVILYGGERVFAAGADIKEMEQLGYPQMAERSARLLNLKDYGFSLGKPADAVVIDAQSPEQAVAEISRPVAAFKRGRRTVVWHPPELVRPS